MSTPSQPPTDPTGSDQRQPRTLILCFDGTSNQFDGEVWDLRARRSSRDYRLGADLYML